MIVLGIIPARGNSKRVPKKNIKNLDGKPLICHTIDAAISAKIIDRLIVSTDNEEIAKISNDYGAEVPFLRPADIAEDHTPDQPVFEHVLNKLYEDNNYKPDVVLNLRPTSPFKKPSTIKRVVKIFKERNAEIVRTVTPVSGVHHPFWMYNMNEVKELNSFIPDIKIKNYYQSQLLPKIYRINGVVDAYSVNTIYSNKIFDNKKLFGFEISDEESFDIDTDFDFKICELIAANKQ